MKPEYIYIYFPAKTRHDVMRQQVSGMDSCFGNAVDYPNFLDFDKSYPILAAFYPILSHLFILLFIYFTNFYPGLSLQY